jgi:uncharacterized protein (DUF427 family)
MPDAPRFALRQARNRWRAMFSHHVIADSADAIILEEPGHSPVVYFPREAVAMEYMARTDRVTHCPFKGDACHYTLLMDANFAENGVWSYEDPLPGAEPLECRIAFYPGVVELYEVDDAQVSREARHFPRPDVDEVVRHTDAGDGHSQARRWLSEEEWPGEGPWPG